MAPGAIEESAKASPPESDVPKTNGHSKLQNGDAPTSEASADKSETNSEGNVKSDAEVSTDEKPAEAKIEETADETKTEETAEETKTEETAEEEKDQTMKCEFKHLDRRYDDKDELYFEERKSETSKPDQKDWWRLFAFCVVRHFDSDGDLDYTRLYVNPEPLRQLLWDVIGNYPSDPINVDDVQIESPYHSLFYYRTQIEEEGTKRFAEEPESLEQVKMLVGWIKAHFDLDIAAYERCVTAGEDAIKAIGYDQLWTLYPPGTIVHARVLNQNRAFRVLDNYYEYGELPGLSLKTEYIDFDGDRVGTRRQELFVAKYTGNRELAELGAMPLSLHDDTEIVRAELLARGRRFESLFGQHYEHYSGTAIKKCQQGYQRFNVVGRVMIDCKTFHRLEGSDSFTVKELEEVARRNRASRKGVGSTSFAPEAGEVKEFDPLSEEDALLTNATVRGYAFTNKRFLEFFVDHISSIVWNSKCFEDLVLDSSIKKTVQALVSSHSRKREGDGFDDIVKGKGQGLVCVLHGPPGVGKTLTAECVAEYVRRPLYMVSSGDLGNSSGDLDRNLTRIMDMTSEWQAVLLIDEADVFLEQRALHDMHRNAMVSVFLRILEYYTGILFCTTNRVSTFDSAFKSRIHIPIRYTDLSAESRLQVWRNFCRMVPGGVDIDERGLSKLAEDHDLNGRQIKNVIKAAESLAAFDGVRLDLAQLEQVTRIQATFEKDLSNLSGIDYTAPGQSKKDADQRNMFL